MADKIYILLPVHNRREITRRFIECLKVQSYRDYHLVLIDDGCIDGTQEMVRNDINDLTVIKGKGDWWWTGSLKQAYAWLKAGDFPVNDIVLIINDDTIFENNFLETAVSILSRQAKTLLQAQCYGWKSKQLIDSGVCVDWKRLTFEQAVTPDQINCLSTRGLFMRMGDFLFIRGFHSRLLPHYASDYEFTMRARRKGMKLMTHPSLKLWVNECTTGYHQLDISDTFCASLKKLFSKKTQINPVIWTSFILLSCPWSLKTINIVRIWIEIAKMVLRKTESRHEWKKQ